VPLTEAAGERRHATVMFCDLVDSTGIESKLYAEKWHDLSDFISMPRPLQSQKWAAGLKKLGDGLISLFGYPVPQENDAERAVRAALAIQSALADPHWPASRLTPGP
jgi:class 3 adenylate cyclase